MFYNVGKSLISNCFTSNPLKYVKDTFISLCPITCSADLHFKKMVLRYGEMTGRDKKDYELFKVSKSTYYFWKKKYGAQGYKGLLRKKTDRSTDPRCIKKKVIDLELTLRKEQQIGS